MKVNTDKVAFYFLLGVMGFALLMGLYALIFHAF